jgi:hypothetical protein
MASTKTLTIAFAVTVAIALSGLQSSSAQGIREAPRPDQSLLEPQSPPDCEFKEPLSNPPTAETRMKLDYERQCYRHSEMIVRMRLDQLQKSIEETTRPTSRQPVVETTKPTSRQPVVETTEPTSRREPKGERHTFVLHPSSGNHRTRDHPVVRAASYLGYPALGGPHYRYMLREDQYEDAIRGGWLVETPREPPRLRAR